MLERYHHALGGHLHTYRNHVYRGLTYHQLLLGSAVPDSIALAWVVHDLGIWTAGSFDYLAPSVDLASAHADEFGITDIEHVRMIYYPASQTTASQRPHDRDVSDGRPDRRQSWSAIWSDNTCARESCCRSTPLPGFPCVPRARSRAPLRGPSRTALSDAALVIAAGDIVAFRNFGLRQAMCARPIP